MNITKLIDKIFKFLFGGIKNNKQNLHNDSESQAVNFQNNDESFFQSENELSVLVSKIYELHNSNVGDLMIPRGQIEIIDLESPWAEIEDRLAKLKQSLIPVCNGSIDEIVGVLHSSQLIAKDITEDFSKEDLLQLLEKAYFIPSGNNALNQINEFIVNRHLFAFVVDEYGEILGGINKDILIDYLFKSTETISPWQSDGSAIISANSLLRDINQKYNLNFPLNGPKTLNGLLLEYLEEIPDADLCVKFNDLVIEIIHCEDRQIKTVRVNIAD